MWTVRRYRTEFGATVRERGKKEKNEKIGYKKTHKRKVSRVRIAPVITRCPGTRFVDYRNTVPRVSRSTVTVFEFARRGNTEAAARRSIVYRRRNNNNDDDNEYWRPERAGNPIAATFERVSRRLVNGSRSVFGERAQTARSKRGNDGAGAGSEHVRVCVTGRSVGSCCASLCHDLAVVPVVPITRRVLGAC